jgi:hypothetical protein
MEIDRRTFILVLAGAAAFDFGSVSFTLAQERSKPVSDFGVCVSYAKPEPDPSSLIAKYPIAVLDSGAFPAAPLAPYVPPAKGQLPEFQERYAYFGIAVNSENPSYRSLLTSLRDKGLLLKDMAGKEVQDPLGPKSFMVDLRKTAARAVMVEHAVHIAKKPGYSGLFMDALDSAIALENQAPVVYKGLVRGTIQFFEQTARELEKRDNRKLRSDAKTPFAPGLMINGGFSDFTADKTFDPLKAMIPVCKGRIMIESQLLDDTGNPRVSPLAFTQRRVNDAASAAKAAKVPLHISFVEPRSKDPGADPKAFEGDAIACKELARKLCADAAAASGAEVRSSVHMAFGNYVAPGKTLEATLKLGTR